MWAIGEPSGPIENGTTYIVRPFIEPLKSSPSGSRISAGSRQLLVGPGVLLALGADEGAVLDPGDVAGVGARQVGVGALGVGELLEGAGVDQLLAEAVVLLRRAVAPVDRVGLGQLRDLLDPGEQLRVGRSVRAAVAMLVFTHWSDHAPVFDRMDDLNSSSEGGDCFSYPSPLRRAGVQPPCRGRPAATADLAPLAR